MLKRALRLGRSELKAFFKARPGYTKGRLLVLRSRRNKMPISRFAFIVLGGKRSAVRRNLARRRMSEALKTMLAEVPKGYDLVFLLKLQNGAVPQFKEIKDDIDYVLDRTGL